MRSGKRRKEGVAGLLLWLACVGAAFASGPRFVTGPPFFPGVQSLPIGWKQANLLYSTDPGNLSAAVPHAAADALVAAAAGVWNLPVASITVGQGGVLAEHVSGADVYLDTSGIVYPADVMSSNAAAVPIAVIYDTDGSVTDTLLGAGASGPASCNANAVTSTVDSFDPAGYILHAIIILNGRCTGTAAAQQLQMQYKLERAFGRVLGLAWSQSNDNVFTGLPTPTYNQALHWPIMHPIDILCGPYSYQCLPNPFTLRPDDVASMVTVYPIGPNAVVPAGKQVSLTAANGANGAVTFPNGQGMAGVNVLAKRQELNLPLDAWDEVSAVTGTQFRRADVSPFVPAGTSALASMGTIGQRFAGEYTIAYIPLDPGYTFDNLTVFTEPVNPLYSGAYSLGPYGLNVVAPSGSTPAPLTYAQVIPPYSIGFSFPIADAATTCSTGLDGVAADPAQLAASGWWNATLCGYGHTSYFGVDVKAGHTFTVEATALDANGLATTTKAMPVIGLFAPADLPGGLPSLGVAPAAFQGLSYGTTVLNASAPAGGASTRITVGVADERGDGRPDYPYQGRMFYADNVEPAEVVGTGGSVTVTGMGFRGGNAVLVNGVAATVTQWSSTEIVATVPTMSAAHATNGGAVDVEVLDRGTGATSTIPGGLTYSGAASLPGAMILLSAPAGTLPVGSAASTPFAVRVVREDGVTPVAGDKIVFSATAGSVLFGTCGAGTCSVLTDATGIASTTVTPLAAGSVTLQAGDGTLLQTASFTAQSPPSSMTVLLAPQGSFPVGTSINTPFVVRVFGPDGVTFLPNQHITFTIAGGSAVYTECNAAVCTATTDNTGAYSIFVTPIGAGPVTLQAAAGAVTRQASFTATQEVDSMVIYSAPNASGYVGQSVGSFSIQLLRGDGVTGDYGEPVTFTVSPGATLSGCANGLCQLYTNSAGIVGSSLSASSAGTFTVKAQYGTLSQTVIFSVTARSLSLKVLSAPSGPVPVGTLAAALFTVQLLGLDGVTPLSGAGVLVGGPAGQASLEACGGSASCTIFTDANGSVSTGVTPLVAGTIPINAIYAPLVAAASVTGVAPTDSLVVMSQPGGTTVYPGDAVALKVELLQPDGATPDSGKTVTYTVTNGGLALAGCAAAACAVTTDAQGVALITGVAGSAGPVVVAATHGSLAVTISFTISVRPDVLQVVSSPVSGSYVGVAAALPFAVRAYKSDGVTPAAGESLSVSVTAGGAGLSACGGLAGCVLTADASGLVSTLVTPSAAGQITLEAADGKVTQSVTFIAASAPDLLRLLSVPASGSYTGAVAAAAFSVQVLLGNGSPAAAGKLVTVTVIDGAAGLAACAGASSCSLATDANGTVLTSVTPTEAGTITLLASDGSVTLTASFTAVARPDVLQVVSVPANGSLVGDVAAASFAVRVFAGDGTTPLAGHAVVLSVTGGSANLAACSASLCTLLADSSGLVSSGVEPLAAGTVSLQAADGAIVQTVSFAAASKPDKLVITSAPVDGARVGTVAATAFAVRLTRADGVTAVAGASVLLSANNALLGACGAATCPLMTDANGVASSSVTPVAAGSVTLTAVSEGLTQTVSFQASNRPDTMTVVSVPADGSPAGSVAAPAFAVEVLAGDGSKAAGRSVTVSVTNGTLTACGASTCSFVSDAEGDVTSGVIPLRAGLVGLAASEGTVSAAASFVAGPGPDTLAVVSVPANGSVAGALASVPFAVKVVAYDGSAGVGKSVTVTVTNARLSACGLSVCSLVADANGMVSTGVTPLTGGAVTLIAADGAVTASASFTATARPDVMTLVSAPAGTGKVGVAMPVAFAVQVFEGDGVTPAAGRAVTFSVTAGQAAFAACGASSCVIQTDLRGLASTIVTPLAPGLISIEAAEAANTLSASFSALPQPDVLSLTQSPGASVYVGATAAAPFAVRLVLADGTTPASGVAITFASVASGPGAVQFGACGRVACVVTTDAAGNAATTVTGLAAGALTLTATADPASGAGAVTWALQVAANDDRLKALTASAYVAEGAVVQSTLRLAAMANGSPAGGLAVAWAGASGIVLEQVQASTDATGEAAAQVAVGPLAGGTTATATACAWTTVCASFSASGVAQTQLQIVVVSGGQQAVAGGAAPLPVVAAVSDGAGHAVSGAAVTTYQTASAMAVPCPPQGRCPAQPVLATRETVATTAADGTVSVAPLLVPGSATQTNLAFAVGSAGFATASVMSQP